MTDELKYLRSEYDRLAQRIKPSRTGYTFLTARQDNGSAHVEFADGVFHCVVTERGTEYERRTTADIREILYWLVYDLTFWMAVSYEVKHRIPNQDFRRVMFAHQVELMKKADPHFAERLTLEKADTLAKNPFLDSLPQDWP